MKTTITKIIGSVVFNGILDTIEKAVNEMKGRAEEIIPNEAQREKRLEMQKRWLDLLRRSNIHLTRVS